MSVRVHTRVMLCYVMLCYVMLCLLCTHPPAVTIVYTSINILSSLYLRQHKKNNLLRKLFFFAGLDNTYLYACKLIMRGRVFILLVIFKSTEHINMLHIRACMFMLCLCLCRVLMSYVLCLCCAYVVHTCVCLCLCCLCCLCCVCVYVHVCVYTRAFIISIFDK